MDDFNLVEARIATLLLLDPASYVRRRKVRLELVSSEWHRRRLTVDITLPESARRAARAAGLEQVLVPISLSEKFPGQSSDYDLEVKPVGCSQLPTTGSCRALARVMVRIACENAAGSTSSPLDAEFRGAISFLQDLAGGDQPSTTDGFDLKDLLAGEVVDHPVYGRLRVPAAVLTHAQLKWLLGGLASRDVLYVRIPTEQTRSVCKLSFLDKNARATPRLDRRTQRVHGLEAFRLRVKMAAWPTSSSHVEIDAPDELELMGTTAQFGESAEPSEIYSLSIDTGRTRGHLYARTPPTDTELVLNADFRSSRRGLVFTAQWVTTTAAMAVTVASLLALFRANASPVVSILVVFPALIATFALQPTRHDVTYALLGRLRTVLLLALFLVFTAGLSLALASIDPQRGITGRIGDGLGATVDRLFGTAHFAMTWTETVGPPLRVCYWIGLSAAAWWCVLVALAAATFPADNPLGRTSPRRLLPFLATGSGLLEPRPREDANR